MPSTAVLGVVLAYAATAVLLLSLNITSLWRWPVKATAIVVTGGLFVGTYFAVDAMMGWPSQDRLPDRASFLASRIVEPDNFTGAPGVIYVWLQPIDAKNLPIGEPRAYKLGFDRGVAKDVVAAQQMRGQGREVLGTFRYDDPMEEEAPRTPPVAGKPSDQKDPDAKTGGAGGMFSLSQDLRAVFIEMPLPLPDKGPYVREDIY